MASSTRANALPQFILTPQQQNLLFRALTSNQPATNDKSPEGNTLSPQSLTTSPTQNQNNSGLDLTEGLQESPFVDYDYDFGPDGSFDFDFNADGNAKMIGDLPGSGGSESSKDDSKSSSPENESSDKRGHPDEDDDDDIEEGGGKRREGEGKVPKKPGRKPLTNEPSSKRKAQNRAAQRAFRERKERHLKDLETKVEELEKASDATNNENSQLKSQIEKLTVELNEYKKRVTLLSNAPRAASSGSRNQPFGFGALQNLSDVNFQFEFPKFGALAAPQNGVNGNAKRSETYPSPSNTTSNKNSPQENSRERTNSSSAKDKEVSDAQRRDASAHTPTNNNNSSSSSSNVSPYDNTYSGTASRTSLDSTTFSVNGAAGASPCSSSNSNMGPSSSCGTSPEPFTQSPVGFKPVDTLTTIGEEQPTITSDQVHSGFGSTFGNIDFGNLDWLSHQNGGQFDPQLFGDYREPQNNILANATLDDSFFNDAFDVDFTTPYNVAPSSTSPKPAKKNICDEIDAQKEKDDTPVTTVNSKLLTCNNIWEKLQTCPKVHNGEIDLDGLCSDLQKKAKCGGTGAVVDEHDFKAIMTRYLGSDASNCPNSS